MYKFTERDLDWDIILEGISETQLDYFVGKDTDYRKYSNRQINEECRANITKWANVLNSCIVLDYEVLDVVARYLSNIHKTEFRFIRGELVREYSTLLDEYNEYLSSYYGAEGYLYLYSADDIELINQAINHITRLEISAREKEEKLSNYLDEMCLGKENNLQNLIKILTISKLSNLM